MFNDKNDIQFLVDEKTLNEIAWEAVDDVCKTLKAADGLKHNALPGEIRVKHQKAFFSKYIDISLKGEIGDITKEDVSIFTEFAKSPTTLFENKSDSFFERLILKRSKNDKRSITSKKVFLSRASVGYRLFLIRLYVKKAILMPYDINFVWAKWLHKNPFLDLYLTEVTKCFYAFHSKSKGNKSLLYKKFNNNLSRDIFAGKSIQLFQCLDSYSIKKIKLNEIFEIWVSNTRARYALKNGSKLPGITSSLDFTKIIQALNDQGCNFDTEKFNSLKEDYLNKTWGNSGRKSQRDKINKFKSDLERDEVDVKFLRIKDSLFPPGSDTLSSDGMFDVLIELNNRKSLNSDNICELLVSLECNGDILRAAKYWITIQEAYYKKKKYINSKSPKSHLAYFNAYLFLYLPLWFMENEDTTLNYPVDVNKFYGTAFITRPVNPSIPMPKTLFEMLEQVSKYKDWEPDTYKSIILTIKNFFIFIEANKHLLDELVGGASEFVNVITDDDIPRGKTRSKTVKEIFPEKIFKTLLSYIHKLNEIQKQLIIKIETGDIQLDDLLKDNSICLEKYGIHEEVNHYGVSYKIKNIPFTFEVIELTKKNGFSGKTIYPGALRVCLTMLETGIRGQQVRWLCESTYDLKCDLNLDHYIQELTVNTNKPGVGFSSFVSSRVISVLREQAEWKNSVECDGYHMSMKYEHSDDAPYSKIFPLFAYYVNSGDPVSYNSYRTVWENLCLGFQWFLSDYNLYDIVLAKYLPVGCDIWDISNDKWKNMKDIKVEGAGIKYGEYCPVSFRTFVTPHGARSTVVSDSVTVLPEEFIGKFMTGQAERTVHYYSKVDSSRKERLIKQQRSEFGMFNDSDDEQSDFEYLSSCRNVNEQIIKKYKIDPIGTAKDNGLFSMQTLLERKGGADGLNIMEHAKAREFAKHASHLCPLNNKCPVELIEKFGETQLCGICPYAVNHVEHLPAISAAKDKAFEIYEEYKSLYKENINKHNVSRDDKQLMEKKLTAYSFDAIGWELREIGLLEKKEKIDNGEAISEFLVERPEEVSMYIEKIHLPSDQSKYLSKRLGDAIAFPLLDSPRIRARFEFAARKLHMFNGNVTEAFAERKNSHPAKELYSLIKSYQESSGMGLTDVFRIVRSESNDFLHDSTKYLKEVEHE